MAEEVFGGSPEILEGTVEDITYRNSETGFVVLDLSSDGVLYTVVGTSPDLQVGETLRAVGRFCTHKTYGPQFKADLFERQMPATATAILKYLSSGAISGIGPATAKKLVDKFGSETLEILEKDPERLRAIKGFSTEKIAKISAEVNRIFGMRTTMIFLSNYGITPAESVLIWNKWGTMTTDKLMADPFLLCTSDIGIPFERADQIRQSMGIPADDICRSRGGFVYILTKNLSNGHSCLPADLLLQTAGKLMQCDPAALENSLRLALKDGSLCQEDFGERTYIYLPQLLGAEQFCAQRLYLAAQNETGEAPITDTLFKALGKDRHMEYDSVQKEAINSALTSGLTVITGGPGTGKTTTVNAILSVLEARGKKVLLCAPTGRAAQRMQDVTGREAKTVHRLLEAGAAPAGGFVFAKNRQNPLDCDVLIVDEMSMVDVLLMSQLLEACPLSAGLVLVGDHNQLPSVGPGNVLRDVIDSGCVPVVTLKKIFRQAQESAIVTNAHKIIGGEMPNLALNDSDFFFLPSDDPGKTAKTVCDLCSYRLPKAYGLDPMHSIQVIAPSKNGIAGTYELNRLLQETLNPPAKNKGELRFGSFLFRKGDKVMQNRNNYDIEVIRTDTGEVTEGVFNGDIGVIEACDRTMLRVRFPDKTAEYSPDQLFQLELAYAVTVHKSQGSEFDAVILPLMNGHPNLYYRNLLYTAVTRAKKLLIVVGSPRTLRDMVHNQIKSRRFSNLCRMLRNQNQEGFA